MESCGLDSSDSGPVRGSCENGIEFSDSIKGGKFFHKLSDSFLRKNPVS
jgi:hypothetical protein